MLLAFKRSQALQLALLVTLLLALAIRLWDLRQPFLGDGSWNEAYYSHIARSYFTGSLLDQPDNLYGGRPVMSTPAVPWLVFISFQLFGVSEWAARLPVLFCGLFTLASLAGLTRQIYGRRLAVVALFFAAFIPGIVFYSRNVQLDGPMVAAGFGALATLSHYRATRRRYWLLTSGVLFTLAIAAKYSGALFLPALTWLWFYRQSNWRAAKRWGEWALFGALAVLPSLIWIIYMLTKVGATPESSSAQWYFFRPAEFSLEIWGQALASLWPRIYLEAGPVSLLLIPVLIALGWVTAVPRRMAIILPVLIIVPWYAQLAYPFSWLNNNYYEYPALYGLALWLACWGLSLYDGVSARFRKAPVLAKWLVVGGLAISYIGLQFWTYSRSYHTFYYSVYMINQPKPYESARFVATHNRNRAPILTDTNMTLYYANADLSTSRYAWWGTTYGDGDMLLAIQSCKYEYIVFEYVPYPDIVENIQQLGYQPLVPGVWQKGKFCSAG